MVDRLSIFSNEVQRVAKDVGVDGKMGGQADVAGIGGRWKEITTDVNTMAMNLTAQVRAFGGHHQRSHRWRLHKVDYC